MTDIASAAEVSVSTVSQVLNGRGRLADSTRSRVLESAEKLGYRKNASRVTTRTANAIPLAALVSTDKGWNFLWNFERELFNTIEDSLREYGFTLILIPIRRRESLREVLEKISVSGASAVFPMHYGNEELFDHLKRMGIPLVVIFNNGFSRSFPSVTFDDYGAAFSGTEYLISAGHRSLCYFDCPMENLEKTNRDRNYGFFNAVEEAAAEGVTGIRIDFKREDRRGLTAKLKELFRAADAPTAAFAVDDDAAMRVFTAAGEIGIRIPEDLSLLSPGDVLDYSLPHTPRISTLQINTEQAGRGAAGLMNRLIRQSPEGEGEEAYSIGVPFTLIDRGSCGPPSEPVRVTEKGPAGTKPARDYPEEERPGRGGAGTTARSRRKTT